jgi:hypothetical protein
MSFEVTGNAGADGFIDLGTISVPPPVPPANLPAEDWSSSDEELSPQELMNQMRAASGTSLLGMIKKQEYKLPGQDDADSSSTTSTTTAPTAPTASSTPPPPNPFDVDVDKEMELAQEQMKRQMDAYLEAARKPLSLSNGNVIGEQQRLDIMSKAVLEAGGGPSEDYVAAGDDGEILDPDEFSKMLKKGGDGMSGNFMASMRESLDAVTSKYGDATTNDTTTATATATTDWRTDELADSILSSFKNMKAPPANELDEGARAELAALEETNKAFNDQFDRRSGFQKPDSYKEDDGDDDVM